VKVATRTLDDLAVNEVRDALAARCHTRAGIDRARARPFLDDEAQVREALQRVEDAFKLRREPLFLALGPEPDLRPAVARAGKGGLLDPAELLDVGRALDACARTREALAARADIVPSLHLVGQRLPRLSALARRIEGSFDPLGTLADHASPKLKEARDRVRGLHRALKTRVDALLHDEKFQVNLQEPYYSVRNDRYVVPVLATERAQVPGIVHNASQTGQTLFVEPQALISLGNDLAIAQSAATEEERRVLQALSDEIGSREQEVLEGLEALAELDEAEGAAHLASDLEASVPDLQPADGELRLAGLRHPLLALRGKAVVPNNVELSGATRAMVISGPNAGGKTVTLTAVGVCALMLRAGLPIPADPGSRLPLYASVHSAIGDAQDMSRDLSTFSAHVTELREILGAAGSGALVLIDEIAADTDPKEGAAIAVAVLEELLGRGAVVLVTTHLEELKALAHVDARFLNARVGFDAKAMAPTYKLHLGAAGSSSAIEVARRVGLPESVCERARELAAGRSGSLARALASTEEVRQRLEEELADARRGAEEVTRAQEAVARERATLETRRRAEEAQFREALRDELRGAREQIDALLKALKAEASEKAAQQARREVSERLEDQQRALRELTAVSERAARPGTPVELKVGGRVRHTGLDAEVEILELQGDTALVTAGPLKSRVPISELAPARGPKPKPQFPRGMSKEQAVRNAEAASPGALPVSGSRCDVRGLRADEALSRVEKFLDRSSTSGADTAVLVHGHGTGALKQTIREYLDRSPYVRMYRPGDGSEGGDGVTVVAFRS